MIFYYVLALIYMSATSLYADDFVLHFQQANDHFLQHRYLEAIAEYDAAITHNNSCPQAYYNKGLVIATLGNSDQAINCYQQALACDPGYLRGYVMLGNVHKDKGNLQKAVDYFTQALLIEQDHVEALVQLAKTYLDLQQVEPSIPLLKHAVELQPHDANIMLDYGNALTMNTQYDEALEIYYQILELSPENSFVLYNIAYALKKKGDVIQAIPYYHRAIELEPNNSESHFGLALASLITGNFEEGWKEYEWRWHRNGQGPRVLPKPLWQGEPLNGTTILLHAEQGLGDTLQFIRYAQIIKQQGVYIIAAVQDPLVDLISMCPYIDKVISLNDNIPPFDYHIPLMSLPLVCKTRIDTIPQNIPYLFAKDELIEYWRNELAKDPNIKIGICWQGNANYSTPFLRHAVAAKSMRLKLFASIAQIPGISVYSLQKVSGTEQLSEIDGMFILHEFGADFDQKNGRFMDTVAVMKNLDLIITIDTSICHLAGGLGVPVWLMLPNPADWRWLLNCDDSPWYPGMRLFRQPKPGDWETVITTIAHELQQNITYYQADSAVTCHVDQATMLHNQADLSTDPVLRQALTAYGCALKRKHVPAHHQEKIIDAMDKLEFINQELLTYNQSLMQEHPFSEKYTRRIQHIASMVYKREMLKQLINELLDKDA